MLKMESFRKCLEEAERDSLYHANGTVASEAAVLVTKPRDVQAIEFDLGCHYYRTKGGIISH